MTTATRVKSKYSDVGGALDFDHDLLREDDDLALLPPVRFFENLSMAAGEL